MKNLLLTLVFFTQINFSQTPCTGGTAGGYPCSNIDLLSRIPLSNFGNATDGNDSWGWTDPNTGNEYAIMGVRDGTVFVDISDPINPIYLGKLPSHTGNSIWRDIKTYNNYAFIVSEASGHGMQVFDLSKLTTITSPPVTFSEDTHLGGFGNAHNIAINEDTGYAYVIGASNYNGGPIFINIQNPLSPSIEGGYGGDNYTHDAQIVTYHGTDTEHIGKEILIASNEDSVTIVDVTDKNNPIELSRNTYTNSRYTHQGWLTHDHEYYIFDDELDEYYIGNNTRTFMMDFSDLDNPTQIGYYSAAFGAIDHNGYVKGNRYYQAAYRAGLRVLDVTDISNANLNEVAYFDTYPANNGPNFNGAWNVYPYFSSGVILISDIERGMFLVKDPNYDATPPTAVCQNIIVTLNASGEAIITPSQVDGGSTDNVLVFDRTIDKTIFTCKDIGANTVTLTVLDGNENKATCTATVTVLASETTYTGSWSNGSPHSGSKAIFNASYTTSTNSIDACECEINTAATVTVSAGDYLNVYGNIVVDGNLIVQHEASVVQTNNLATVTNNGNISVQKTTANLGESDFMILGNPMTMESREGVYGNGKRVLNHITGNFIPNGNVGSSTENFADDNNNNWGIHSGLLTPAEGYLVKPQSDAIPSGVYNLDYTLGTLNNGELTFNLLYNGTRESSPNMLGNPYASAIDNDLFLEANPLIDAIYYWQHITPPNDSFPGFNQLNFNLGDISVYNQGSGGVAASNGGGIPTQFMASGQGFAVKALGAGTAIFNNTMRVVNPNTDYRSPENEDRQRIWLDLKNESYGLFSNMLVAFTPNASNNFENKYDSKRIDTPISIYSVLDDHHELAIQGRSAFSLEQEVHLGFNSQVEEEQVFTISINQLEGVLIKNVEVYLRDTLLHTQTNLSKDDYTFTSFAGQQNDRFVLFFKEKSILGVSDVLENISVFPNPTQNFITIEALDNQVLQATIFDISGRQVGFTDFSTTDSNYQINLSNLDNALYFVEIKTKKGTVTRRVIKN